MYVIETLQWITKRKYIIERENNRKDTLYVRT